MLVVTRNLAAGPFVQVRLFRGPGMLLRSAVRRATLRRQLNPAHFAPHLADVFDHRKPATSQQHQNGEPETGKPDEETTFHGALIYLQTYDRF